MADKYDAFLDGEGDAIDAFLDSDDGDEIDAFLDAPDPQEQPKPAPISPGPTNMYNSGMGGGFLGLLPPAKGSPEDRSQEAAADTIMDNLPMLGATAATIGIPGAGAFTRGVIPFLKFAGQSALQAATGGGIGGAVESAATGQPIVKGAVDAAVEQGAADLAGSAVLKGVQVAGAPVARKISQEGSKALKFAVEKGLPANPAEVFPTWLSKSVNNIVDNLLPGRFALKQKSKQIANALTIPPEGANQLILDAAQVYGKNAPEDIAEQVTESVTSALQKIRPPKGSNALSEADEAYDAFFKTLGDGFKAKRGAGKVIEGMPETYRVDPDDFPHLAQAFENIEAREAGQVGAQRDDSTLQFIYELRKKFSPALKNQGKEMGLNGEDLYKMKQRLSRIKGDKRNVGELRDAILSEFEKMAQEAGNPGAIKTLQSANATWAAGRKFANHRVVKQIAEGNVNTAELFNKKNLPLLKDLSKRMPAEQWNGLLAKNLEDMLNRSATLNGATGVLDGGKLLAVIDRHREMFEAVYPKETLEAMENLGAYAKVHKDSLKRADADLLSPGATALTGGLGWLRGGVDPTIAVGGMASYGIARALMDPQNPVPLFRWLTGTLEKEGGLSLLSRSGLRFASQDSSPERPVYPQQ